MKRYVIYCRVSTKEQGRSGLGLAAQQRDIDLYLENYSGAPFEILGSFTDVQSGSADDRPELAKALQLVRETKGAELLVAKLDRLSRRVSFIASLLDDKRVALRVAAMPHADKFQLHIYAALAEQEREFISIRTKQALAAAKGRGVQLGGNRGSLKVTNDARRASADEFADKVWPLIEPMLDSGKSLRAVAVVLNDTDQPTANGGKWTATTVRNLKRRKVPVS